MLQQILEIINNETNILILDDKFTNDEIDIIFNAFAENISIKILIINFIIPSNIAFKYIINSLLVNRNIEELIITNNVFNIVDFAYFIDVFYKNKTIRKIDVGENEIDGIDMCKSVITHMYKTKIEELSINQQCSYEIIINEEETEYKIVSSDNSYFFSFFI
jgi:hypothetical protein